MLKKLKKREVLNAIYLSIFTTTVFALVATDYDTTNIIVSSMSLSFLTFSLLDKRYDKLF